jgi:hypothetical protein
VSKPLQLQAYIDTEKGKDTFVYSDKEWIDKVKKFKSKNFSKKVIITFEIVDTPMHFLFEYYHGYLLPDITEALGESSQVYVDKMILKKQFLFIEIDNDFSKVDKKHKDGNQFFTEKRKEWLNVTTNNFREYEYVIGYTPSKAYVTHEEMKKYIQDCENFLFNFLGGCISQKHQEQAEQMRRAGFEQKVIEDLGEETNGIKFEDVTLFWGLDEN